MRGVIKARITYTLTDKVPTRLESVSVALRKQRLFEIIDIVKNENGRV